MPQKKLFKIDAKHQIKGLLNTADRMFQEYLMWIHLYTVVFFFINDCYKALD